MGPADYWTNPQLNNAYAAAEQTGGFVLFISFDMAAGNWSVQQVADLVNAHKGSRAQLRVEGRPFVSTFEGPGWADNWGAVRQMTGGIFLVPDWSSLGAQGVGGKLGAIDGACELFSFSTALSASQGCALTRSSLLGSLASGGPDQDEHRGGHRVQERPPREEVHDGRQPVLLHEYVEPLWLPFVPANTWPDLPQWSKNWYSSSESLWFDRWQQVLDVMPDFVEIITCECIRPSSGILRLRQR